MTHLTKLTIAIVLLTLAAACTSPERSRTDGTTPPPDDPESVDLTLVNTGVLPVVLQQPLVSIATPNGEDVTFQRWPCDRRCGEAPEVCNVAIAEPAPVEVLPGDRWEYRWDGAEWSVSSDRHGSCLEKEWHTDGKFVVTMCWTPDNVSNTCDSVEFELGRQDVVDIEVGVPAPERRDLDITLINEGDDVIEAFPSNSCGAPGFFQVLDESGQRLTRQSLCGPCSCTEGYECGGIGCPDIACGEPEPLQLEPGDTIDTTWDMTIQTLHAGLYGGQCSATIAPPDGTVLQVCYWRNGVEECQTQALTESVIIEGGVGFIAN